MGPGHEVLLAVSLLTVFLSNDIVVMEMEPLLRMFGITDRIIRKDVSLIRKIYVFCLTYVYTHKIETSLASTALFTMAEILYNSNRELAAEHFSRRKRRTSRRGMIKNRK